MQVERTIGPECGHVPKELDSLQFAAELQFDNVANREIIARVERQRLQRGIVQVGIGRREATHSNGHGRPGTIWQKMRIGRSENG